MTWEHFTRAVEFGLGVAILVTTIASDHVHWGVVILALFLMGVIGAGTFVEVLRAARARPSTLPHSSELDVDEGDPPPPPEGRAPST